MREEIASFGKITISTFSDTSYWLEHEEGEGMVIPSEMFNNMLEDWFNKIF